MVYQKLPLNINKRHETLRMTKKNRNNLINNTVCE